MFGTLARVTTYSREDDLVVALQEATKAMANGRFTDIARCSGDEAAATAVTAVADVYVAWLRRLATVTLTLVAIEEIDTGTVVSTGEGDSMTTNIDTSQQARYVINAADDRGFPVDATLGAASSDENVVTVFIEEATSGTASGKDELVARFNGSLGTATVTVFDLADPTVVLAADTIVANPGNVAAVSLGAPTIEEIPAEPPAPEPAPEP